MKPIVRRLVVALVVLGCSWPAAAQTEATERFSQTGHLDRNGTLDLSNMIGDIVITAAGDGQDVLIDAVKRVRRANARAAQTLLQMIDIQVVEQANRLEVRAVVPRPRSFPGAVDFTISVPLDTSVTVRTLAGNIRASNIGGALRAEAVNGDVVAVSPRQLEALKCVSGHIEIVDGVASELAMASTVSGDITVRGLRARAIELSSVSGNIQLHDTQADRLVVRAVSGNVDFSGGLVQNGRYQFASHSGDLRLSLSGPTGFAVQASSFSGTVQSDFTIRRRAGAGGEGNPAPARTPRAIRGTFGDGSALVVLRAFSGNISLTRR